MRTLTFVLFAILVVPAFAVLGQASGNETYSYFSNTDGYLAGTVAYNDSFLIAGSNHLYEYKNGTMETVYSPEGKVITDIKTDGTYIYLALAELHIRSSGTMYDGNGGSGSSSADNYTQPNNESAQQQTVPSAPKELSADPDSGVIHLGWYAPDSDGNSTITKYEIYRGLSAGHEALIAEVSASSHTYNDTDVQADTTYYYYVTAVNAIGESPASNEVFARIVSNSGGGATVQVAGEETTSVTAMAGFNATNFTILKLDSSYNVVSTYVLSQLTIYTSSEQLTNAAQIVFAGGDMYLAVSGEYANNTLRYITEIYQLNNGQFIKVFSEDIYAKKVVYGDSHFYILEQNSKIDEYDSSFTKLGDSSALSTSISDYESIVYSSGLHIAGGTMSTDYKQRGEYIITDSAFSIEYAFSLNQSSTVKYLVVVGNTTAFVDAANSVYVMKSTDIHTLQYLASTNTAYMRSIASGTYNDLSRNIFKATYIQAYTDNASRYHYVWGGHYLTWDNHMYMYITLTDKPAGWLDLTGFAGVFNVFTSAIEIYLSSAIVAVLVIIVSIAILIRRWKL